MQVILIESNETIRGLLSINLKNLLDLNVIIKESAEEAIALLEILPDIDLILSENSNGVNQCLSLVEYIKEKKMETPLILLGDMPTSPDYINKYVTAVLPDKWEEVLVLVANILSIDKNVTKNKTSANYVPIPISYFLNLETTSSDIFIRIKKSAKDFQFVKRIHRGDVFSTEVIQKYQEQGLQFFYITKEEREVFTTFMSVQLIKKLNNPSLDVEEKVEIMSNSFDILASEIKEIGFKTSTVQITETIVNNIIEINKDTDVISPLLRKVLNAKSGYIYQHSHLCAIVASEMAQHLNLKDKDLDQKFAYASLFKDISLVDNEHLAQISKVEELEDARLDDQKWDLVFNHALEGSVLIQKCTEAPDNVDVIIKSHHGTSNGKGFVISAKEDLFDTVSMIFIIAIEFVNELMAFKIKGGKPRPIVEILYNKYENENTRKIINALKIILKQNEK